MHDKHIDILIHLASINNSGPDGKPAELKPLPGKTKVSEGYVHHADIGIYHLDFHIDGDESCKGVMIEEVEIKEKT